MTKINDLNTKDVLEGSDKFVIWDGATRTITAQNARNYFEIENIEVESYAALKALTVEQIENNSYVNVTDSRGGLFAIKEAAPATVNALLATDPGEGVYVALNNGAGVAPFLTTKYAERVNWQNGPLQAAWWGVVANAVVSSEAWTGTDNTTALNNATAFMRRKLVTEAPEGTNSLSMPPGFILVSSADFTGLRGTAWVIHGNGCQLVSKTPGKVVADFLHSRNGAIHNLSVCGDISTPPRRGFQTGYISTSGISASNLQFHNCSTVGYFTECAEYNGGSEETTVWGAQRENKQSTCIASIVLDAYNEDGRFSDYQTGNLVAKEITGVTQANPGVVTCVGHGYSNGQTIKFGNVGGMTELNGNVYTVANATTDTFELSGTDTTGFTTFTSGGFVWRLQAYSFVNIRYINSSGFTLQGGYGMVLRGGVQNLNFWGYLYSPDKSGVLIYTRNAVELRRPTNFVLNAVVEGSNLQACIETFRDGVDLVPTGWEICLNGIQPKNAVFLDDNSANQVYLSNAKISIGIVASPSPTNGIFHPAGKWAGEGVIYQRPFSGLGGLPEFWNGKIAVQDGAEWAFPEGTYEIDVFKMSGAEVRYTFSKGQKRFVSNASATIADTTLGSEPFSFGDGRGYTAPRFITGFLSLTDDTATSFALPPTNLGAGSLVLLATNSNGGPNGMYYIRGSASPNGTALTSGGTPATVTTGPLTGTTGSDGVFTISAADDGRCYLENRLGSTISVQYTVISAA